jgi:essential nuclear protein 1
MPKAVPVRGRRVSNPIYSKYDTTTIPSLKSFTRKPKADISDNEEDTVIPEDITKKILSVAREQLNEEGLASDNYSEPSDNEEGGDIEVGDDYCEDDEEMQMEYARKHTGAEDEQKSSRRGIDLSEIETDLPAEVIEHYTRIGKFLSCYTVGKIPKGFKVLPTRKQWEELLYFTNPVEWTAHAHYQATKIFASNLNDNLAQRYFNLVLLPAVRSDIKQKKKLHFQLYQALKKAMFKPLAFMKGILIPLADAQDCTLREAVIVGSVVGKMTVPMAYGAASLFKLASKYSDNWTPVKSLLITMLVNKKYALPTQVVEGLVSHYESFAFAESKMPVLWHTSLLTFVQRYKDSLTGDQKSRLLDLIRIQSHYQISPEVRRELTSDSMDM